MVVGAGTKAYAGYEGAKNTRKESEANAYVEELNTAIEASRWRREAEKIGSNIRRTVGSLKTMFAANHVGLGSGSAEDIMRDSVVQMELDRRNAQHSQSMVSLTGAERAKNIRRSGKAAYQSQMLGTIGGLFGDAASIASMKK
jgi:hypothetical protein